jgi:hypothetical protein
MVEKIGRFEVLGAILTFWKIPGVYLEFWKVWRAFV